MSIKYNGKDITEIQYCNDSGELVRVSKIERNGTTIWSGVQPNYLTLTAGEAGSTVKLFYNQCDEIYYSKNDGQWTPYTKSSVITLDNIGDNVKFKAKNFTMMQAGGGFSGPGFTMTGSISASGSVTSLIDGNGSNNNTLLTEGCFYSLFSSCHALKTVPELPSVNLAINCYEHMFSYCDNIISTPVLSSNNLQDECYNGMFIDCTSLKYACDLNAEVLKDYCYREMFSGCSALERHPEIKATTLGVSCCYLMFKNCSKLEEAKLPETTTMVSSCYRQMYEGCTKLSKIPKINVTALAQRCFYQMFKGCSNLRISENGGFGTEILNISSSVTTKSNWNTSMFEGTFGSFTGSPRTGVKYYSYDESEDFLCFAPKSDIATISLSGVSGDYKYSYDKKNWDNYTLGNTITLNKQWDEKVYFSARTQNDTVCYDDIRGKIDRNPFDMTGEIYASGNLQYLLDSTGKSKIAGENCFESLFFGCSSLITPPSLKATELSAGCYTSLFYNCNNLIKTPELPALSLGDSCYNSMFYDCEKITKAPDLHAKILKDSCYNRMFANCASLLSTPEIHAETLAEYCCESMFEGCESLIRVNPLSADKLEHGCYNDMFIGCTSLKTPPELPSSQLSTNCYSMMFANCGLTSSPYLSAETLCSYCYMNMFYGCDNLRFVNRICAKTLADSCFCLMFSFCSNLKISENGGVGEPILSIDASARTPTNWNRSTFIGTGGSFKGSPSVGKTYYCYQ